MEKRYSRRTSALVLGMTFARSWFSEVSRHLDLVPSDQMEHAEAGIENTLRQARGCARPRSLKKCGSLGDVMLELCARWKLQSLLVQS